MTTDVKTRGVSPTGTTEGPQQHQWTITPSTSPVPASTTTSFSVLEESPTPTSVFQVQPPTVRE